MKTVAMVKEALFESRRTIKNLSNEIFELNQELIHCSAFMPDFILESKIQRLDYLQTVYKQQLEVLAYYEKKMKK